MGPSLGGRLTAPGYSSVTGHHNNLVLHSARDRPTVTSRNRDDKEYEADFQYNEPFTIAIEDDEVPLQLAR